MTGEKDAIARAIYERRNGHGCKPWSLLTKAHKEPYLGDAEAVLALFAPILAEKEREIERACANHAYATIGWERERGRAEEAEARALAAEAARDAFKLALIAEKERADMATRQMIKQNNRLAALAQIAAPGAAMEAL